MSRELLARLRGALAVPRAQPTLAPGTPAAVLVPVFERDGALHLLYITRSATLPLHAGQVAFPGGRHASERDPSLLDTALRETEEEIGLAARDVDVLGALDPIHTFSSNFVVTPFVGRIPYPYELRLDPREVQDAFTLPLAVLDDPRTTVVESWTREGRTVSMPSYRYDGRTIWGATQRITASLVDLLTALRVDRD